MSHLFSKSKGLEEEIDHFYDSLAKSALTFKEGIKDYILNPDNLTAFHNRLKEIKDFEHDCDQLRRSIRYKLYSRMLIPDSRGDVLGLLENSDNVADSAKKVLINFDIEKPVILEFIRKDFIRLADSSAEAVDGMVKSCRAFFREFGIVNDYINKVHYYESETDKIEDDIKRKIFDSSEITSLSVKVQLRYFAEKVALLSDMAEDVCERLSVYVIKREL